MGFDRTEFKKSEDIEGYIEDYHRAKRLIDNDYLMVYMFRLSGMTQVAFCERIGITTMTLQRKIKNVQEG